MQFGAPLLPARLIKRYKRFLADVIFDDGQELTVYCPNTGSMMNCAEPDSRIWLSHSDDAKRKYAYTWQLVETDPCELACIHSALANNVVKEAVEVGLVPELQNYDQLQTEVRYGEEKSRIDLLLTRSDEQCYVEIKCVTLHMGEGLGLFPDAVSARGTKHLRELALMKQQGHRAVLLFCVQNTAIDRVGVAVEIDAKYAQTLQEVIAAGVEVLVYNTSITPESIILKGPLPFIGAD
ncbi:MAG: DNA/RNA nuclease SfsA [Pseudomonadales bacterium]